MTRLDHTIRRARRRRVVNNMLHGSGIGLAVASVAAIALLLGDRFGGGWGVPLEAFLILSIAGLVLGAAWPLLKVPRLDDVALHIDRALNLKDRIATARLVSPAVVAEGAASRVHHDAMFMDYVQRDAENLAGRIDIRTIEPIRISRIWSAAAALTGLLWLGVFILPSVTWGAAPPPGVDQQASAADVQQHREELRDSIEQAIEDVPEDAREDEQTQADLQALERLAQQLQAADGDEREMQQLRDEAAARMSELSEQLAERARQERMANEQLAERFAGLEQPETPMSAQEFSEALQRGDFGRAADSLEQLLAQREKLSPQERRELAEHLQSMADSLDQAQREDELELAERAAQLEQALRDQGLDPQDIQRLLNEERSQQDMQRDLRDQGVDEDIARRLARELQRLQEQREVNEQVQRDSRDVSEALEEAAEQLDEQADQEPGSEGADQPADDAQEGDTEERNQEGATPDDESPSQSGGEQPTGEAGEQRESQPTPQSGDDPSQQPAPDGEQSQSPQPDTGGGDPSSESEQSEQGQGEAQSDQPDPDGQSHGEAETGEGEDGGTAEGGESGEGDAPGEAEGAEGAEEGQGQPQRRPGDALRDMQQRRDAAQQRESSSQRVRDRARELASGQERGQSDRTGAQSGSEAGSDLGAGSNEAGTTPGSRPVDAPTDPFDNAEIEDIDLRDPDAEGGELIAEWLSDEPQGDRPLSGRSEGERRVREAQEIAERAVNDSAVPSRYHDLIRRYFGRLNETVDRAASEPARDHAEP